MPHLNIILTEYEDLYKMMTSKTFLPYTLLAILFLSTTTVGLAQKKDNATIAKMVASYKTEVRGPYRDIRWFCKDGTTLPPQERCAEKGGVQRARYRDEVIALGNSNHIFLGQILSTTANNDFWDEKHNHSRLKQFQMQQFLKAADDGWVLRKAQFYRGAFQAEDEEAWGIKFYEWLLADANRAASQFFLIRQSAKDVPHAAETNVAQNVRALSKDISDNVPSFMELRVKLHGQPERSDIEKVKAYRTKNKEKLSAEMDAKIADLLAQMDILYSPIDVKDFDGCVKTIGSETKAGRALSKFIDNYSNTALTKVKCQEIAVAALTIRTEMASPMKPAARLALIDASNRLESLLIREAAEWKPTSLHGNMLKVTCLAKAAAAFGYLEMWEWEQLSGKLLMQTGDEITLSKLERFAENAQRSVEWSSGMIRANYDDVIRLYAGFEPLAAGFVDDRVRSSILLQLGDVVSDVGDMFASHAGFSNRVMNIPAQSSMRGLNSGYALGELVVTNRSPDDLEISGDRIYVFNRPPSDLKPVAGIATVTEGNMVSHVQLLARNLGIPNAVLSAENLNSLLPFNGRKVFFAVSTRGTVVMKPASDMTEEEKALFSKKARSEEKISVPVERMNLTDAKILNLRTVDASLSGKICGPKAANLGQLKKMFPENVVEGLVIPFSIFREHFNQEMPGQGKSFWKYLNDIFTEAASMRKAETPDAEVEKYVLAKLDILQTAIKKMPLSSAFQAELRSKFKEAFGKELGQVPVFLRSDTNMEDLKDFTGAGLNLTLFNVLEADRILQGIKDVWASPYTDRSYKWRQKYLLNPENVFPSILIIPSVNADYSGVLITKGVSSGKSDEITVAFNRGVGGAVEGQASETWSLSNDGHTLVTPAREPEFTTIPATGGTGKSYTGFSDRLLTDTMLTALQAMAGQLNEKLPATGLRGPYDVELGFKDGKIWLFQVRPFVENKRAAASDYLRSITPELDGSKKVPLNAKP